MNETEPLEPYTLEELRRELQKGFDQIERGEYTEYASGKEWARKILKEARKRAALKKAAGQQSNATDSQDNS